ncbi:retrovirus-related pol polyprotein from transposon TNT 1-94 [Tanacetum coccineum]|uniref:Retrovirus-related pol polyprotein from transposon TNT 1-94 n=1 Tax=Tanacetum coccineum TaxID=301880 RepID=A0ABQ4XMN4_9ASTR
MRPFGCTATILNTIDHLGKFDGKADEGFFVGYSLNSKAFRVFNSRTRIVEENLHIRFSQNTHNVVGSEPDWLFDIDSLTRTMNYEPIVAGTQSNGFAGTKASDNVVQARKETEPVKNYILLPLWPADPPFSQDPKSSQDDRSKPSSDDGKKVVKIQEKIMKVLIKRSEDGMHIYYVRIKYVGEILKKFGFTEVKTASTPIESQRPLLKDEYGDEVVNSDYARASLDRKSTTGDLTLQSFDMFCGAGEKAKKTVRLMMEKLVIRENRQRVLVSKRIERVGENKNRKRVVWNKNKQSDLVNTVNREVQLQALVDGKKIIITESTMRRDLQLEDAEGVDCLPNSTIFKQLTLMGSKTTAWNEFSNTMAFAILCLATNQKFNFSKYIFESMVKNLDNKQKPRKRKRKDTQKPQSSGPTEHVADEAVYKELDDSLVRDATTASSLEAEQDSGNINKTRSKATPNESSSLGTTSGGGPRCQETIGDTIAQTRFENVSKLSNDLLLTIVLDLEKTKTTQAEEIISLKKRGRINAIDADEDITLVNDQDDADMFDVNTLTALAALKSVKPKVKANVVEEPSVLVSAASTKVSAATTTTTATIPTLRKRIVITELGTSTTTTTISSQPSQAKVQDKGKGIMVEEHVKKLSKKKDLIRLDEEIASKLQAKFDEEERLAREKEEANLAQRLQAEEQEQFTTERKATLFKELIKQRRKHFAAKRAKEKRKKPPTQAQQRKIMCTYLKNMEGKKPKDLKNKSFDSIQKMFDRAFKKVNTFVEFRTDLVEGSSKRAGDELEQEVTKKQKVDDVQEIAEVDDDQETTKIKELMEIFPDEEEVSIDAILLATKPPTIVDWKNHKEGKKIYYQIIRADRSLKIYLVFSHMLKSFNREDLETLWKLIKAKYGSTRLVEALDLIL